MYDTIYFYRYEDRASNLLALTPQFLNNVSEHFKDDGRYSVSGTLNNMIVKLFESGVSIKGSLAKYYLNDNIQTLTRQDSARAIQKLSDELHLDISDAIITRIDFAHNFIMSQKPTIYYPYLGESQYFTRLSQPESLYYKNGNRTKLFYDKLSEAKFRAVRVPEVCDNKHLLRYEIRYSKRLDKQLKVPEVRGRTLSEESFYIGLIDRYILDYKSIHKNPSINFDTTNMATPKDFWMQLAVMKADEIGQPSLMELIEEMREKAVFDKPEYYSRLKKELRDKMQKFKASDSSYLIEELDSKISALKRYYR
jgi:hypothetical protein